MFKCAVITMLHNQVFYLLCGDLTVFGGKTDHLMAGSFHGPGFMDIDVTTHRAQSTLVGTEGCSNDRQICLSTAHQEMDRHVFTAAELSDLGSSLSALSEAIAVTAACCVGAAAAAGEAQLGEAFLNGSVAGQITGLLFLEGDRSNVVQDIAVSISNGITVDEHELDFRVGNSSSTQSGLLQEAAEGVQTSPETVLTLISTLYFEQMWSDKFEEHATAKDTFTKADGSEITTDFIEYEEILEKVKDENGNVICTYTHRNQSVSSISYTSKDGTVLPIKVVTTSGYRVAEGLSDGINTAYCFLYPLELLAVLLIYFKKRAK